MKKIKGQLSGEFESKGFWIWGWKTQLSMGVKDHIKKRENEGNLPEGSQPDPCHH
jgi:hypothetical protein